MPDLPGNPPPDPRTTPDGDDATSPSATAEAGAAATGGGALGTLGAKGRQFGTWFRGTSRPKQVALAGTAGILALGALLPAVGLGDEMLAFVGETVFRVGDLPDVDAAAERTEVLDRDGELIGTFSGPENRVSVPLDTVPEHLVAAVLSTEDRNFFEHEGVSISGIARAMVRNVLAGGVEQGGSTITQQYVKNALLTSERSFDRKITEATWAVRIEQEMDKEEILRRYLDIVYLGDGTYGVGAAANYWFNKDVSELTVADSALLAGMIRAPEANNPAQEPDTAQERRDIVLTQMVDVGAITEAEAEKARATQVVAQLDITPLQGPEGPAHGFFTEYVKQVLLGSDLLGKDRDERAQALFGGGLQITTTLDSRMQKIAEATLAEHLTDPLADPMGGIVSVEPSTGAVRTMAMGPKAFGLCRDESGECTTTTVNPLAPGMGSPGRQVGSAFKPIVTAAALAGGASTSWHTPVDSGQQIPGCGDYRPKNYDGSGGVEDMASALAESNNVFHVKLAVDTGLGEVVKLASDLGISRDLEPNCSLALGSAEIHPLDMAIAYATFANGGVRCDAQVIVSITDRKGEVLDEPEPECDRVLDEEVADAVTTMLRGVADGGTAKSAGIGRPIAAKTGTTNDNIDAWLVGFTKELSTATWVGFELPKPMEGILGYRSISGGTLPAKMWAQFMSGALDGIESADLARVKLARYSMPECPPPPARPEPSPTDAVPPPTGDEGAPTELPTPAGDDPEATAFAGAQAEPKESSTPAESMPEGFDPVNSTWDTDTDGDDFAKGDQPEQCTPVAPPEAYASPEPQPSASPSASTSPSQSPSASESTTDGPSEPSSSPSPKPSSSPSAEPSSTPSPEPSPTASEPQPEPSPTTSEATGGA